MWREFWEHPQRAFYCALAFILLNLFVIFGTGTQIWKAQQIIAESKLAYEKEVADFQANAQEQQRRGVPLNQINTVLPSYKAPVGVYAGRGWLELGISAALILATLMKRWIVLQWLALSICGTFLFSFSSFSAALFSGQFMEALEAFGRVGLNALLLLVLLGFMPLPDLSRYQK